MTVVGRKTSSQPLQTHILNHIYVRWTLTRQAERLEAELDTVEHDETVGGVQFTSLLRVALKITRALSQPQLPDLSYVN